LPPSRRAKAKPGVPTGARETTKAGQKGRLSIMSEKAAEDL
jgi:hypothetical protein